MNQRSMDDLRMEAERWLKEDPDPTTRAALEKSLQQ